MNKSRKSGISHIENISKWVRGQSMNKGLGSDTKSRFFSRAIVVLLAFVFAFGTISNFPGVFEEVYAKSIGSKNEMAKQACEGTPPTYQDHYGGTPSTAETKASSGNYSADTTGIGGEWSDQTDIPYKKAKNGTPDKNGKYEEINGVWTGGNAHSAQAKIGSWTDSDINDFQSVLPFGTIYIDPTKLYDTTIEDKAHPDRTWKNWYRGDPAYPFTKDTTITLSEYAADKFMLFATKSSANLRIDNGNGKFTKLDPMSGLYYQRQEGSWEERIGYIGDFTPDGKTEVYDKENDGKALITVRYPNVATLSDGSSADLVIKYTKVTIETDLAANVRITFKDANEVEHTINAPLGIIDANQLYVDPGFSVGQDPNNSDHWAFKKAKFGVQIEYEVSVEKDGVTQPGTILWTANDLDIDDRYTGEDYNTDGSKVPYAESMEILDGAKSYAVTPYYDHTTPANPLGFQIDSDNPKSSDSTANGVRFFATRQDGSTYDSGFSALISSSGTKMRWTGSKENHTHMGTVLFDTTVINQIRMSHGTGGGIYLENYDGDNDCKVDRIEGIAAHGLYAEATLTAVPEDGYRVKAIYVDDTGEAATGYDATQAGKTKYEIKYKEDNGTYKVEGIVDGNKVVKIGTDGKYTMSNGIVFEVNADGTVDVTMKRISNFKHVHVDFEADYYFEKIWKVPTGSNATIPDELELKATPFVFEMTSVEIDGTKYDISEQGTKYTNTETGAVYTMNSALVLTIGDKQYRLHGNVLKLSSDETTEYTIEHTITSGTTQQFTVNKTRDKDFITVEEKDGETIWKIKYPAKGRTDAEWPELPIETTPKEVPLTDGNGNTVKDDSGEVIMIPPHGRTHVERNYWFVTEVSPEGWSMVDYDNDKALAPGVVSAEDSYTKGDASKVPSIWRELSVVYHDATEELIEAQEAKDHAFMSPLSSAVTGVDGKTTYTDWGGKITNYPAIIIKAEKEWKDDFDNDFNTRQDILFHLDAVVKNTTIKDYLPPIKVPAGATGDALKVAWGDKKIYTTADDLTNVEIINDYSELKYKESNGTTEISYVPQQDNRPGFVATSEGDSNGKIYYVNELPVFDASGNEIKYSIRETSTVKKTDGSGEYEAIIGYEEKTNGNWGAWTSLTDGEETTASDAKIRTKSGKATNTLETVDVRATKEWDDNDNQDGMRADITLAIAPSEIDVTKVGETKDKTIAKDATGAALTVEWKKLPAVYNEKPVDYSVTENTLNGYTTEITPTKNADGDLEVSVKNTHIPESASVSVFKAWDDKDNQDGLRKAGATVILQGKTESESQYIDVSDQDGTAITKGEVPTEDGLIITWTNLPVYRGGKKITYKLSEDVSELDGYYTDITYADEIFELTNGENKEAKVTNKETPELTEITITKVWDDAANTSLRPDSVKVQLKKTYQAITDTTKEVNKQVTVNGTKYDVKNAACGTEYFVIDGVYYLADGDITDVNSKVEEYSKLTVFAPSNTDETVKNEDDEDKKVDDGGTEYTVKKSAQGTEYYVKEGKYYDPDTKEELTVFNPTANDAVVKVNAPDTPTYEEKTETKDYELSEKNHWSVTIKDLDVNAREGQKIVYTVDEADVPAGYAKTVTSTEPGKYTVTNSLKPPKAVPEESTDWRNLKHTKDMKSHFTADPEVKAPDGSDNKIENIYLVDASGKETDTVTVPGEGTYKLNTDGTITFTPERDFVGKTSGVKVRGYDSNGLSAETTYTPTVIMKVEYYDPMSDKPDETVDEGEAKKSDGSDVSTDYEGAAKSKSKNHTGYRFNGWKEEEVEDDTYGIKLVRRASYTPMYNINYDANGGTGTMEDDDYAADDSSMPDKNNTFTRKGYTFKGFYAYIKDPTTGKETIITDASGDPILFTSAQDMLEYFKDKPGGTSIRMEAQWEKNDDPTPTPTPSDPDATPTPDPSPQAGSSGVATGDYNGIIALVVVLVAAACVLGFITYKRRKTRH